MSSNNVVVLNKSNFDQEVLQSQIPVLVDFWAEWCGPCKMLGPVLEELAIEYEGKLKIGKVKVDAQQELANQFNIRAVPTLLVFHRGKVREQIVGLRSKDELKAILDNIVK